MNAKRIIIVAILLCLNALLIWLIWPKSCGWRYPVPGVRPSPSDYYTMDMSLVSIQYTKRRDGIKQPPTIRLPRAMIRNATPYKRPDFCELPDNIVVSTLRLKLVYLASHFSRPTVKPFSVALRDEPNLYSGVNYDPLHREEYRIRTITVVIGPRPYSSENEKFIKRPWRTLDKKKTFSFIKKFDDMEVYNRSVLFYYLGLPQDEFYYVSCSKKTKKTQWCTYKVRINENFNAQVSFASIEHNGGRDFANDRIKALRHGLCKYMKCDMVAEDGSLIKGKEQ